MKWPLRPRLALRSCVLILLAGQVWAQTAAEPSSEKAEAHYEVRGVLINVDEQAKQVTITHEKIPGYMGAMTMSFGVGNIGELSNLHSGDTLAFRLCVTADHAWIDRLRKINSGAAFPLERITSPQKEFVIGETIPDIELSDQHGDKIRLSDFRGKVLALTFIYTTCPLPTYCPRMNRNFQTARELIARLAPERNWHFLSLSFDAPHDSAQVLTAYAGMYGGDPQSWTFASADENSVRAIGDGIGLEFKRTENRIDHNLRTVVIDANGRLRQVFRGNNWTPQELAAQMSTAMRPLP